MGRGAGRRRTGAVFAFVLGVVVLALVSPPAGTQTSAAARRLTTTTSPTSTSTTSTTSTTVPQYDAVIPPVEGGLAPVIRRIETSQPVVFLTIDDGGHKAPFGLDLLRANNVRASLFLAEGFIRDDPDFFVPWVRAGYPVENHSITHRPMPRLSFEAQVGEICGQADRLAQLYGSRPTLFRPPGGAFNVDTRRAAAACGMRAVVHWSALTSRGTMQYQLGNRLRAGDIVLMHFRPEFRADMHAFVTAMHAAGLHTELLEDWIHQPPTRRPQATWTRTRDDKP